MKKNRFKWSTLGGNTYEGEILEVDNCTLIVKCTDGKTRAVYAPELAEREKKRRGEK